MAIKIITPPLEEPITIGELRSQLRGLLASEEGLVMGYLSAAREAAEKFIGIALAEQTWEVALDRFPGGAIELPGGTVNPVVSVNYVDEEGVEQTLDAGSYALDDFSTPNWLLPAYGTAWPSTYPVANAVKVRYVVGGQPLAPSIRAALLLMVGDFYENREDTVVGSSVASLPNGVRSLLQPHRVTMGV